MEIKLSKKQEQNKDKKIAKLSTDSKQTIIGYLFISPWLIGFLLLTLWPMVQSLYLSFTRYSLLDTPKWIGLTNYSNIFFNDPLFTKSLSVTFAFVLIAVPLKLMFSLFVATLLNKDVRGMSFYRTAIYFPSLIGGSIAVSILWRNIFGIDGYANLILGIFGVAKIAWIADPSTALGTLILLNVWQFGATMIIFLAGLKSVPKDLYEAASIDGAGKVRTFFNVTIPMLSSVIFFNLILGIIGAFQMFNSAFIITQGGPANATLLYALFLYNKAFKSFKMGYASSLAWILLVIIAVFTAINFLASKYWVFYEDDSTGGKRK
ncbi:MAG TPA: sugar ABC transporter permease [Clostridiaceae bacterium]